MAPALAQLRAIMVAAVSAGTRASPASNRNPDRLRRLLYLGGDFYQADDACLEDSMGCALPGEGTDWGNRGRSCPSRLYLEFYRHTISRVALCIMHMDDDFGRFTAKDCRRSHEAKEIPRWYSRTDTWRGTGGTTHQQDDGEKQ
jgi:hypothetical protein